MKNQNTKKSLGQTFTPDYIVNKMLDLIFYNNQSILTKTILEPSCGDGAFLLNIATRLILQAKAHHYNENQIVELLETNLIGIEIDIYFYQQCLDNLDNLAKKHQIMQKINWQIYNVDALSKNLEKVDFIIGNPPYVRIHNLTSQSRLFIKNNFRFCASGTTDLYIAFYELALQKIKNNGKICFITPNSFLRNQSGKVFREYVVKHNLLDTLIDFGNYQVFDKVSTYTAICVLAHNSCECKYFKWQQNEIQYVKNINLQKFYKQEWCFDIESKIHKPLFAKNAIDCLVCYGIATLRDKIYIANVDNEEGENILFNGFMIEKAATKPIIKASLTNPKKQRIIYPYSQEKQPIDEKYLQQKFPLCYAYLLHHKADLLKRDIDENACTWYQYGRSQGIKHMSNQKLIISSIVKNKINSQIVDQYTMIYSGMFIVSQQLDQLWHILQSNNFLSYVLAVGKDMQNGYKNFNTKHIKYFLDNYV